MGIRCNKVIGYGAKNITDSVKSKIEKFASEEYSVEFFVDYFRCNKNIIMEMISHEGWIDTEEQYFLIELSNNGLLDKHKEEYLSKYCHYDFEFGFDDLILFSPPGQEKWKRYNDIIDWAEIPIKPMSNLLYGNCSSGIYPYASSIVKRVREPDKYITEQIEKEINSIPNFLSEKLNIAFESKIMLADDYIRLNEKPVFKNENIEIHFKQDWRPLIPPPILVLINMVAPEIFDDGTIDSVRPMIYSWWS